MIPVLSLRHKVIIFCLFNQDEPLCRKETGLSIRYGFHKIGHLQKSQRGMGLSLPGGHSGLEHWLVTSPSLHRKDYSEPTRRMSWKGTGGIS